MNLALAKLCVQASANAYSPTVSEESLIQDVVTDTVITIVERADENCILIACRGTKSLRNFVIDVEAWHVKRVLKGSPVEIHAGFIRAAEAVIQSLLSKIAAIQQLRTPQSALPIILTGHSLGGALAVLLALYLEQAGYHIEAVYTFGQPRIGNAAFAAACHAHFGERHVRFDDAADVVPCVPGLLAGYRHSGEWAFLNADQGLALNPSRLVKIATAALDIWSARNSGPAALDALLADHHVARYSAKVNALTEPSTLNPQPSTPG